MYKLYYVLKDSRIYLLRNKMTLFFKSIFTSLYTFILMISLHAWIISSKFEALEKQKAIEEANSLEEIIQSNSSDHLITLVTSLKISFSIFSVGLLLFGITYLFIHFQKVLLLDKKELVTKKMLGSSATRVTCELFLDSISLIIPGIMLGTIITGYLYTTFFHFLTSSLTTILDRPRYVIFYVYIPLAGLFLVVFSCQFLYLKHKITKL
ncbi:FtsX-like permease family protein [Enterococcus quebecensis]|uniref:ABC3 transporter permease C-terminal domain-containing protein n=1 Tax=Enterococcus quebecensis TaxID=903983 RepID=A0A1E5H3H4_9ENTE|nr:FtsX-like permease family protein [Enterococcus quebecensis]OEG19557.1 hypothetical protein BCR23_02380 [Enterococcus quebecensis]OJG75165.1 hypothetical protein RV12_GL001770 [Enterococcus quebecensis]